MATISIPKKKKAQIKSVRKPSLLNRYLAYAAGESKNYMLWYLKSILIYPTVIMTSTIFVMGMVTPNFVWFIGLSVLLFYVNVIAHIGGAKSNLYVPLYHATTAIMILIPLITYLIG